MPNWILTGSSTHPGRWPASSTTSPTPRRRFGVHYLRGPVDLLRIGAVQDGNRVLELCRPGTVLWLVKEKLLPEGKGSLVTLGRRDDSGRLETELSAASDLPGVLTAHLNLFYQTGSPADREEDVHA